MEFISIIYCFRLNFVTQESLELVWADVQNSSRLNDFLNTFNLELPVHRLKPQFKSKVSWNWKILVFCVWSFIFEYNFICHMNLFSIVPPFGTSMGICIHYVHFKQSYRKLLERVRDYYFRNATSDHDKAVQLVNMVSDLNMIAPIDRAVKTQAKQSKRPTYYYRWALTIRTISFWECERRKKTHYMWYTFWVIHLPFPFWIFEHTHTSLALA